jgi:hypothetical protein
MSALRWQTLNSSNIGSAAYDAEKEELHVKFKSSGTYIYEDIDNAEADDFFDASSHGKHFHSELKHKNFRRG